MRLEAKRTIHLECQQSSDYIIRSLEISGFSCLYATGA